MSAATRGIMETALCGGPRLGRAESVLDELGSTESRPTWFMSRRGLLRGFRGLGRARLSDAVAIHDRLGRGISPGKLQKTGGQPLQGVLHRARLINCLLARLGHGL